MTCPRQLAVQLLKYIPVEALNLTAVFGSSKSASGEGCCAHRQTRRGVTAFLVGQSLKPVIRTGGK